MNPKTMKKLKLPFQLFSMSAFSILLLSGCIAASVPKTVITGSIGGKPFTLSSPKDSDLAGLKITADTNGAVSITLTSLAVRMNPDVITTTGDAQVKLVNAVAAGVINGMTSVAGKVVAP